MWSELDHFVSLFLLILYLKVLSYRDVFLTLKSCQNAFFPVIFIQLHSGIHPNNRNKWRVFQRLIIHFTALNLFGITAERDKILR